MPADLVPIRRALISVSDKTGLTELATALADRGTALVSTGGTAGALRAAGLAVTDVAEVTGFPGDARRAGQDAAPGDPRRPARPARRARHAAAMAAHGIAPIDLLVVNLYPFEATVAAGAGYADCVENIDIGGPAMLRAAAKNHAWTAVVTDPRTTPRSSPSSRPTTARRRSRSGSASRSPPTDGPPPTTPRSRAGSPARSARRRRGGAPWPGRLASPLRYGENPHQGRPSTPTARRGPAWRRRASSRARR
jgi:phosphoribosylaminoimidazolecarboxamide formyltransferase / IMP cyclohydrolase